MDKQEGLITNRAPIFDGSNYVFWKIQMFGNQWKMDMSFRKLQMSQKKTMSAEPIEQFQLTLKIKDNMNGMH